MASLYIDRKNITLKADGKRLLVCQQDGSNRSLPLCQIDRVITHGTISLDSRVLGLLVENDISITLLNTRKPLRTVVIAGGHHNEATRRLAQYELVQDEKRCQQWSQYLVARKLKNQYRFLRRLSRLRPDGRYMIEKAREQLRESYHKLISSEQLLNQDVVRGIEGAAAAGYFKAFGSVFADSLGFNGRNRRPPRDPVNAAMSLVYTLMHAETVVACHDAGLDPMLGFYHQPYFGRESLACDLVEPLRPLADAWVWQLFRSRILRVENFSYKNAGCYMDKVARQHFYAEYEKFASRPRRLLKQITRVILHELKKH